MKKYKDVTNTDIPSGQERKMLFLDFDGVLTSDVNTLRCRLEHKPKNLYGLDWFDPDCLSSLQRIVDKTGAFIVVSSSWRELGRDCLLRLWNELKMPGKLCGVTPVWVLTKKEAIEQWLKDNKWDRYVILDDADMGMEHAYRTNKETGLTPVDAERVIELLNLRDKPGNSPWFQSEDERTFDFCF